MKFHFISKIRPFDFFKLLMKNIYKTPMGIVNIVFTIAMILLTGKFFNTSSDFVQLILVIACLIFPVFQPLIMYFKAKNQVAMIPSDLTFDFEEWGLCVSTGDKSENIPWSRIKGLYKEDGMVILRMDGNNGYFLNKKTLGKDRDDFISFAEGKIK